MLGLDEPEPLGRVEAASDGRLADTQSVSDLYVVQALLFQLDVDLWVVLRLGQVIRLR